MKDCFLGVDLGGTAIKIGLVSEGNLISSSTIDALSTEGMATTLPYLKKAIDSLVQQQSTAGYKLKGIGMGFAGLVDNIAKRIISTNKKYSDAPRVDLEQWVSENWNVPFVIDNDARMAAVGEWIYGAGRGCDDLVSMTLGTGIGSAVIMNGRLLRGKHFQAGVLGGHISVQYNGRQCTCGNAGCAEAYSSTWSLQETITGAPGYSESVLSKAGRFDFKTVFEATDENDPLAQDILRNCLDVWSAATVNLIHAYDPERVVIGGGVMKSSAKVLPYITKKVHENAWCPWGKVDIRASTLVGDAGILGATYLISNSL